MTPEQRCSLETISYNFRYRLEENNQGLPLICYALNPYLLPDDLYEQLKDVDLAELRWYGGRNDGVPGYFLGALLLFIRNFYERGDGHDIWKSTPSLRIAGAKKGFTNCIKNLYECKQWRNVFFPRDGKNIGLDWVRSQCWILKAKSSGDTSEMLTNNAIVYKHCVEVLGSDVEWADLLDDESLVRKDFELVRLTPDDFDDPPRYLDFILSNYKVPYLLSLYALVASADDARPSEIPHWLSSLWSSAYVAMRRERRKLSNNTMTIRGGWKLILNGNEINVQLRYQPGDYDTVKAIQENSEFQLYPFSYAPSLYNFLQNGFDVHKEIILIATKGNRKTSFTISGLRKEALIFSCSENDVTERSLLSEKGQTREVPSNRQIYVVTSYSLNELELTFDGILVALTYEARFCGGYMCYSGVLPRANHPAKAPFAINGKTVMNLIERPAVHILNAAPSIDATWNNARVYVIEGIRLEYASSAGRVTIDPAPEYVEGRDSDGDRHIRHIDEDNVGVVHKITASRGSISKCRSFICLPVDWKKSAQCTRPSDEELYEAASRGKTQYIYTTSHGEQVQLETEIDNTLVFWVKSEVPTKCGSLHHMSDIEQYNKLTAYTNLDSFQLDFTINGKSRKGYTDKSSITVRKIQSILKELQLRRGDKIRITINNVEAFSTVIL